MIWVPLLSVRAILEGFFWCSMSRIVSGNSSLQRAEGFLFGGGFTLQPPLPQAPPSTRDINLVVTRMMQKEFVVRETEQLSNNSPSF